LPSQPGPGFAQGLFTFAVATSVALQNLLPDFPPSLYNRGDTAISILVSTGTSKLSGFFLKKKPPCTIRKWQHVNRDCSSPFESTGLLRKRW
jgi:hypothetical protein